jgi:drug/metabolite transporter (DMT)-like permease
MDKLLVLLLMILDCAVGSFGALYMKKGSASLDLRWRKIMQNIKNKNLIIGIALYLLAASLLIYLLKYNELSLIYPLTSITYIFTIGLSIIFLKEHMTKYKWLAVVLIIAGNILITI